MPHYTVRLTNFLIWLRCILAKTVEAELPQAVSTNVRTHSFVRRLCSSRRCFAAVAMLKQSINSSYETPLSHGIMHERHIFYSTFSTVCCACFDSYEIRISPWWGCGRKTRRWGWLRLQRSAKLTSPTSRCQPHSFKILGILLGILLFALCISGSDGRFVRCNFSQSNTNVFKIIPGCSVFQ